jgi:hypothetical protein
MTPVSETDLTIYQCEKKCLEFDNCNFFEFAEATDTQQSLCKYVQNWNVSGESPKGVSADVELVQE